MSQMRVEATFAGIHAIEGHHQKLGTIAFSTIYLRGHGYGTDAVLLCTRADRSGVAVSHALRAGAAQPHRPFPDRLPTQATPQALQRAQTVCWTDPEAALRPL
jgi:hypothetical protein